MCSQKSAKFQSTHQQLKVNACTFGCGLHGCMSAGVCRYLGTAIKGTRTFLFADCRKKTKPMNILTKHEFGMFLARRTILSLLTFACCFNTSYSQTTNEIISELKNTFETYDVGPFTRSDGNKWMTIYYNAPVITLHFYLDNKGWDNRMYHSHTTITFDVLKTNFRDTYSIYSSYNSIGLELYCRTGIEVVSRYTDSSHNKNELPQEYVFKCTSNAISNRLINGFKNLQSLAKEDNVKQSLPNILDNAELVVQKISFVTPDESGKLKANQTGCIRVELNNTNSNNAVDISCVVNEQNKSELFSFDQYTPLNILAGYATGVINVQIKASESIDNNNYQFDVKVMYKGFTLKQETISISTANPKRQQIASNGTGGISRNKTIRMRKNSGNTYLVSCKVNGLPLDFIFDTGASSVTLSRKQASFMLRNGYLSKEDIVGSSSYQTANGDIATGMVIKLKKIDISGLVLNNVEATIINSDSAPLLLGQSALSRLGKIQIDYKSSTLTIIR